MFLLDKNKQKIAALSSHLHSSADMLVRRNSASIAFRSCATALVPVAAPRSLHFHGNNVVAAARGAKTLRVPKTLQKITKSKDIDIDSVQAEADAEAEPAAAAAAEAPTVEGRLLAAAQVARSARHFSRIVKDLGLDESYDAASSDLNEEELAAFVEKSSRLASAESRKLEKQQKVSKNITDIRLQVFKEIDSYRSQYMGMLLERLSKDKKLQKKAAAEGRILQPEELAAPEALEFQKSPYLTFYDHGFLKAFVNKNSGIVEARQRQYARKRDPELLKQLAEQNDPTGEEFDNIKNLAREMGIEFEENQMHMRKYSIKIAAQVWHRSKQEKPDLIQKFSAQAKALSAELKEERDKRNAGKGEEDALRNARYLPSPYFIFCSENFHDCKQQIQQATGEDIMVGDKRLHAMLIEKWTQLPAEEKNKYHLKRLQLHSDRLKMQIDHQHKKILDAQKGNLPIKAPLLVGVDSAVQSIEVFNSPEEYEAKYGKLDAQELSYLPLPEVPGNDLDEEDLGEPLTYYHMLDSMDAEQDVDDEENYLDGGSR